MGAFGTGLMPRFWGLRIEVALIAGGSFKGGEGILNASADYAVFSFKGGRRGAACANNTMAAT